MKLRNSFGSTFSSASVAWKWRLHLSCQHSKSQVKTLFSNSLSQQRTHGFIFYEFFVSSLSQPPFCVEPAGRIETSDSPKIKSKNIYFIKISIYQRLFSTNLRCTYKKKSICPSIHFDRCLWPSLQTLELYYSFILPRHFRRNRKCASHYLSLNHRITQKVQALLNRRKIIAIQSKI